MLKGSTLMRQLLAETANPATAKKGAQIKNTNNLYRGEIYTLLSRLYGDNPYVLVGNPIDVAKIAM